MPRSPLLLAALAAAALPEAHPVAVRSIEVPGEYDAAEVTYTGGTKLIAQVPASAEAGLGQGAELAILAELQPRVEAGELPFRVPEVVGSAPLPEGGGRVVLTKPLEGSPVDVAAMRPGPGLASGLGRALAAVHELPSGLLERLELPMLSAADCRARHLLTLEAAGASGLVPTVLLNRWESFLDDDELWDFEPTAIHGDLGPEYVLEHNGQVNAILGWANTQIGDPAEDLAWLVAAASDEAGESLLRYYQDGRGGLADPALFDRAMLLSELALARWLQFGLRENHPEVVKDAQGMLTELAAAVS